MQLVHGDAMQQASAFRWREGDAKQITLLGGAADGLDNYLLSYGEIRDYFAPRHKHNFEQIRVQLKGELDFGRDGTLKTGMFGYFPEGLPYGPQTSSGAEGANVSLVMQCGGASGSGYISQASARRAYDELSKHGTFEGGVYQTLDAAGHKRNVDAFQALWEHVCGRPMFYPKSRYDQVILADPDRFDWVPALGQGGVFRKPMGAFTERLTRMEQVRIERGAIFRPGADVRDVYFVCEGRGTLEREELRPMSAMEVGYGEAPAIEASEDMLLILFGLPDLRD